MPLKEIRKVEPEPSACINENIGASYFQIAEKRGIAPSQLENILKGELDRVVMKCLEKDPKNRYNSVGELKRDIESYVTVSQGKKRYRKVLLIAAVGIVLVTVLALVTAKSKPDPETPEGLLTILTTPIFYENNPQLVTNHLTTNGAEVWDWLYAQSWFKDRGIGKVKEIRSKSPRKEIVLEYESVEGVETISAVFLEENGLLKFDDLYLYNLNGDAFNMYLSYLLNNPIKAKAEFLLHNPLKFWRPFSNY